jgi:holo-[acyl-carrier protein] synthase
MEQIVGIGIDQIECERVYRACQKESFVKRIYSAEERLLLQRSKGSMATNFAGKEAVVKAFGTGFVRGIAPAEIEILRRESGAPYVRLCGNAERMAQRLGIENVHISLSDTKTMATAFAVAVGRGC